MATYYIDWDAGSDSNNGLSTGAPLKRHPYMTGFSGNYTHLSGDRFIFKIGVTWPASVFPFNVTAGGSSSGNRDYYGVDPAWTNGGTRAILDAEYTYRDGIYLANNAHIEIDSLEIKRVTWDQPDGNGCITGGTPNDIWIHGCHLHSWQTTSPTDGAHGGVVMGTSVNPNITSIVVEDCEIENSANGDNGVCVRCVGVLRDCEIHNNSSAALFALVTEGCYIHDIAMSGGSFDPDYHLNGVYCDPTTQGQSLGRISDTHFNNVSGGANMAYLNPREAAIECYNNLFDGEIPDQRAIEIDPFNYGSTADTGEAYVYNNTGAIESSSTLINVVDRGGAPKLLVLEAINNHVIGTSVSVHNGGPGTVVSITSTNNLIQTAAEAASEGYNSGNGYAPISEIGGTVDTGADLSATFSEDINGASRPALESWDIGAYEFDASTGTIFTFSSMNVTSFVG